MLSASGPGRPAWQSTMRTPCALGLSLPACHISWLTSLPGLIAASAFWDVNGLGLLFQGIQHLVSLQSLNLYYNCISSLAEVFRLHSLAELQDLDLRLNPVVKSESDCRLFVVHMLPKLRQLGRPGLPCSSLHSVQPRRAPCALGGSCCWLLLGREVGFPHWWHES